MYSNFTPIFEQIAALNYAQQLAVLDDVRRAQPGSLQRSLEALERALERVTGHAEREAHLADDGWLLGPLAAFVNLPASDQANVVSAMKRVGNRSIESELGCFEELVANTAVDEPVVVRLFGFSPVSGARRFSVVYVKPDESTMLIHMGDDDAAAFRAAVGALRPGMVLEDARAAV